MLYATLSAHQEFITIPEESTLCNALLAARFLSISSGGLKFSSSFECALMHFSLQTLEHDSFTTLKPELRMLMPKHPDQSSRNSTETKGGRVYYRLPIKAACLSLQLTYHGGLPCHDLNREQPHFICSKIQAPRSLRQCRVHSCRDKCSPSVR